MSIIEVLVYLGISVLISLMLSQLAISFFNFSSVYARSDEFNTVVRGFQQMINDIEHAPCPASLWKKVGIQWHDDHNDHREHSWFVRSGKLYMKQGTIVTPILNGVTDFKTHPVFHHDMVIGINCTLECKGIRMQQYVGVRSGRLACSYLSSVPLV